MLEFSNRKDFYFRFVKILRIFDDTKSRNNYPSNSVYLTFLQKSRFDQRRFTRHRVDKILSDKFRNFAWILSDLNDDASNNNYSIDGILSTESRRRMNNERITRLC